MQFFSNLQRTQQPSFFFFPSTYAPGLRHFLEQEQITGCEIVKKQDILPHLPAGFKIPTDIRLTPDAPRIEKRVSCITSYYTESSVRAAYERLLLSQEWLDWHNNNARIAMAEYDRREAAAKDPAPGYPFKQTN